MTEILCSEKCPFRKNGDPIRPCSSEVHHGNMVCVGNIQGDPAFTADGQVKATASMNNFMFHSVEIKGSKGRVAIVNGGRVHRENIAEY